MKGLNYNLEFELTEEDCFTKENHDLVMQLINFHVIEIERKFKDISEKSPVSVSYSDFISIFIFNLKNIILIKALEDIFIVRKKYDLDQNVKEYINDNTFYYAINEGIFEETFATLLQNMNYDSVYKKMQANDFADNLINGNYWYLKLG